MLYFHPLKGVCESWTQCDSFDSLPISLCSRTSFMTLKITNCNLPFWNLENVLSPDGTLRSRTRMGSIWYFFHFIVHREGCSTPSIYWRKFAFLKSWKCFLPKGLCKAEPHGVHFDSFHFIVVWEGNLTLSIYGWNLPKKKQKKFYFMGWIGWDGTAYQKCP